MTEDQAKRIAFDFVAKSKLDPCEFDSIRAVFQVIPRHSEFGQAMSGSIRFAFESAGGRGLLVGDGDRPGR